MMTIGTLARKTAVTADCVRFYGRIGLICAAGKTGSGYKLYDEACVRRVLFIKHAQRCGFSLPELRELLDCEARADPMAGYRLALEKKQQIEGLIPALSAMVETLARYVAGCTQLAASHDVSSNRAGSLISAFSAPTATHEVSSTRPGASRWSPTAERSRPDADRASAAKMR